jgi:hypothetical protein
LNLWICKQHKECSGTVWDQVGEQEYDCPYCHTFLPLHITHKFREHQPQGRWFKVICRNKSLQDRWHESICIRWKGDKA